MSAPSIVKVRLRGCVGLLCALTALVAPSPFQHHAAASAPPWGTVLVPGHDWAGQYADLGDLNVYSNGTGNQDQPEQYGLGWECVELAQRWAALRYHEQSLWPVGRAAEMWGVAPRLAVPFTQIPNGSAAPQFGDLVVFDSQPYAPSGHVAVVAGVGPGYVDLVEENWAGMGFNRIPMTGNVMPPRWGLTIIGWLRGPGGSTPPQVVNGAAVDTSRRVVVVAPDATPWVSAGGTANPFRDLAGQLVGSAAVTAIPSTRTATRANAVVVGTGRDLQLWARTDTAPDWMPLAPSGRCLSGPGADVIAQAGRTSLAVGCRGVNNATWTFVEPIHRNTVDTWRGAWIGLGGSTHSGVAIGSIAGSTMALVTGDDGHLYAQPVTGGDWRLVAGGLSCVGRPALSAANGVTWVACEGAGDRALRYSSSSDGTTWSASASAGGVLVDGPSLIAMAGGTVTADVVGADHRIWETTLAPSASASPFMNMGWVAGTGPAAAAVPLPSVGLTLPSTLTGDVARILPNTSNLDIGSSGIDGATAVVSGSGRTNAPSTPLYVATFPDHTLHVRSDTHDWQVLSPSGGPLCLDGPGAAVTGTTLTVTCQGAAPDHALLSASGPLPTDAASLPSLAGWRAIGGTLTAGPAAATVGGVLQYAVVGAGHTFWKYTAGTGYTAIPGMMCQSRPALVSSGGSTVAACTGLDAALWWVTEAPDGTWSAPVSAGGVVTGGVAMAGFGGQALAFVRGPDNNLWETSISADDAPTGWATSHSGVTGAVGAGAI